MNPPNCPICRKPTNLDYRPFCSRRCADVDLQRWLTGRYVLDGALEGETEEPAMDGMGEDF